MSETRGPALVVHPHFHRRRTGVTSHVEAMLRASSDVARGLGWALDPALPRVTWRELLRRLRRERVVWHAHRNLELLVGLVLRALSPLMAVVFTRHSARTPGRWTRFLVRRADRAIALTEPMAAALGTPSKVVSHGVDLARFRPPPNRGDAWRARGLGGSRGIGVIGRIRPDKGQHDVAKAWARIRHPDWRLVFVGDALGPHRRFLDTTMAAAGEGALHRPAQKDIADWYRSFAIVAQPSHSEGFSLVLLEALASGCCVVAAQLPHFHEWIDDGQTGYLYPPGDVDALAARLSYLLRAPEEVAAVGARAAQQARERFGVEREARVLTEVYEEVSRAR